MDKTEINVKTGEIITRDFTIEELEKYKKRKAYIPGQDDSETL